MDQVATLSSEVVTDRHLTMEELLKKRTPIAMSFERYRTVAKKGGAVTIIRDDERGKWIEIEDVEFIVEWSEVCKKNVADARARKESSDRDAALARTVRKAAGDVNGRLRDVLKACYLSDSISPDLKAKIEEVL